MTPTADTYYWASGRKVRLTGSDQLAVDLGRADEGGLPASELASLRVRGRRLSHQLVLLGAGDVSGEVRDRLESLCVVHPVYRAADATVVVLPEVRVEMADADGLQRVEERVRAGDLAAHVAQRTPGRLVLVPETGRGADALVLANRLTEEMAPDLAQARFLRVVPRRP